MTTAPELAGSLEGGVHRLPVRVYYEDTDFTGVVYHANYLKFMERGRSDFLRLLGIHHAELLKREEALAFAVQSISVAYKSPARIDDTLSVVTGVQVISGARIVLDQKVMIDDRLLISAEVTIAMVTLTGKPRRLPADVRDAFIAG